MLSCKEIILTVLMYLGFGIADLGFSDGFFLINPKSEIERP
jgi:hypothetical protein